MKRYTVRKPSPRKRILALILSGVIMIGLVALLSKYLITSESSVYEPVVTSDYQPQEKSDKEVTESDTEDPIVPEEASWPITYSIEESASLTVVVNKKHRLPSNYVPELTGISGGQMRSEAATALSALLADAEQAGNPMVIISSYRSYQTQISTYQYWVDLNGQEQADRESARPGHSEHQTGLAVDLGNPDGSCRLLACFGTGAAGSWLAENAHIYGFIIRYPEGKEELTGYIYEPWHIRFVGIDVATKIFNSGLTMDQYFDVPAGSYY